MPTPREQLLQMLAEQSFHLGEFKLSSGGSSDYYIDCRATTLSGEGARLVGRVFYEEIYNSGAQPEAVGGLTLGADPIVTAVAMLSAQRIQGRANIEKAAPDAPFVSLFTADQVREEHLRMRKHEDDPLLSLKREVGGE